jgi:hypothetical protein
MTDLLTEDGYLFQREAVGSIYAVMPLTYGQGRIVKLDGRWGWSEGW